MDLIINSTFKVLPDERLPVALPQGIYRVLLCEVKADMVCIVRIATLPGAADEPSEIRQGRPRLPEAQLRRPRRPPKQATGGKLIWLSRTDLLAYHDMQLASDCSVARAHYQSEESLTTAARERFLQARKVMSGFLDLKALQDNILLYRTIGPLVSAAVAKHSVSRSYVYSCWRRLISYGLHESSLVPEFFKCGAPGGSRPYAEVTKSGNPRKKAGRKADLVRIAQAYGRSMKDPQPGMSADWLARVRAADKSIKSPKPRWPERHKLIIMKGFCSSVMLDDGQVTLNMPPVGSYPNLRQVQYAVQKDLTKLTQQIERTTKRHHCRQLRGLVGRAWQGVAGPGHTYAIDSTVGDIYLRSSLNRHWIIGRPIVYVIVDFWSTAVVGFYVCLTGPSWSTAKVSLFNASAPADMLNSIYKLEDISRIHPTSTLPHTLLCDRGEYLSLAHELTAKRLSYNVSFTPPYSGDLKGTVEVLHRIEKDAQFLFIPGAIDQRREELELRKVNPMSAVFNLREFVEYLTQLFLLYNYRVSRQNRLDAEMIAAGIEANAAGLWSFGHEVGVGFRRHTDRDDLTREFLTRSTAHIGRNGVSFANCFYSSDKLPIEDWATLARVSGGWSSTIYHHPGSMRSIWMEVPGHTNLVELQMTSESRGRDWASVEEWSDALAVSKLDKRESEHQDLVRRLDFHAKAQEILTRAKAETMEALSKSSGPLPTFREARLLEVQAHTFEPKTEAQTADHLREELYRDHEDLLAGLLRQKSERAEGQQ